jgi:hypothetical protein
MSKPLSRALMLVLALAAGCAERKPDTISAPPAPPAPPAATSTAPTVSGSSGKIQPTMKLPPRPAGTLPEMKPQVKPPESQEPLILSPSISEEHKDKLESAVATKIRQAEHLVARVDTSRLTSQQSETFSTIQNFLSKAKEALQQKDMPRALNLAEKAQTLAQELPSSSK